MLFILCGSGHALESIKCAEVSVHVMDGQTEAETRIQGSEWQSLIFLSYYTVGLLSPNFKKLLLPVNVYLYVIF